MQRQYCADAGAEPRSGAPPPGAREQSISVRSLLDHLGRSAGPVRRWREVDELSPQEIAERRGVSAARVRQIERRALAKLRAAG